MRFGFYLELSLSRASKHEGAWMNALCLMVGISALLNTLEHAGIQHEYGCSPGTMGPGKVQVPA